MRLPSYSFHLVPVGLFLGQKVTRYDRESHSQTLVCFAVNFRQGYNVAVSLSALGDPARSSYLLAYLDITQHYVSAEAWLVSRPAHFMNTTILVAQGRCL
jgi:hypothetical protein